MRHKENTILGFISGAAIGAGLMYLADPDRGSRRRSGVRDKVAHGFRSFGSVLDKGVRDLRNRARGTVAETWSAVSPDHVWDEVLVDRVRAKIGRSISHPSAIEVTAKHGRIILSGPVLESEADDLIDAAYSVRGVRDVESRVETHKTSENVPGLQGGSGRTRPRPELLEENWAPGTRLLVGAGGAIALAFPTRNRNIALPSRMIGGLLLARATTNLSLRRFFGLIGSRRAVRFQKTITIHAPIEQVFEFWSNPENFAKVMEHVEAVKRTGENRFRWMVSGPAGSSINWTSRITQSTPNQMLAWRSEPGSVVRSGGIVRFQQTEDGGTRIHLLMSYNPPAGAVGHALATLFGVGPKNVMDDDLVRMKSLFEQGKTTAHGETVTREQLSA
ncbi:MAG: hypothetical protein DMG97_35260 [Acidobacteria bacterium]|nr:MAG: hypothetical protein DMG97_35260 [Acidobacteriota bacterium]